MENSTHQEIINRTVNFVKHTLQDAEGGHDWFHIERVCKVAKTIAEKENVDLLVVELGALLHDIADSKFHDGDESIGPRVAGEFMNQLNLSADTIEHVQQIIRHISFKGGNQSQSFTSKELKVVQDADRLDAIGAIGIARAFNYGGYKNRSLYNPAIPPQMGMTKEEYKKNKGPTINHFYEKLLLLKERMNTPAGKAMAERRHQFMQQFLDEFYQEWDGNA